MEHKTNQNLAIYAEYLQRRKIILLREKLRRLKIAEKDREEAEKSKLVKKTYLGFRLKEVREMSTYMNAAAKFAAMSDDELFGTNTVWEGEGEF